MTDSEMAQDRALTTEQIAAAGRAGSTEGTSSGHYPPGDRRQPASATQAGVRGDLPAGDQAHAQLLEGDEMQSMLAQWKDIQAEFVDEPRKAVQDADALVANLMQRLARMFASERDQLESRWSGGGQVSTEDLRDGLRRYRSFFERLLAA
jgi:transposase